MIDLEVQYRERVRGIVHAHLPEVEVRVFGSRVNGKARRYSDLDLVLVGKTVLDTQRMEEIRDAFSESDLPIHVDLLDWHALSDRFRKVIEKQCEVLP